MLAGSMNYSPNPRPSREAGEQRKWLEMKVSLSRDTVVSSRKEMQGLDPSKLLQCAWSAYQPKQGTCRLIMLAVMLDPCLSTLSKHGKTCGGLLCGSAVSTPLDLETTDPSGFPCAHFPSRVMILARAEKPLAAIVDGDNVGTAACCLVQSIDIFHPKSLSRAPLTLDPSNLTCVANSVTFQTPCSSKPSS
jgi:hypothetical protein